MESFAYQKEKTCNILHQTIVEGHLFVVTFVIMKRAVELIDFLESVGKPNFAAIVHVLRYLYI